MQYFFSKQEAINLLVVLGHTAAGKTRFAAHLAAAMDGEIISADSRQVYREMDIGTGKDLQDYTVGADKIPYHLINIVEPGTEYNVYEYQKDFLNAFELIHSQNRIPVLCGGTGMYIEAVLKGYTLIQVPLNPELRERMGKMNHEELTELLYSYKTPHNITDTEHRKRLLRAIEIADYYQNNPEKMEEYPNLRYLIFGISYDWESRRKRITARLRERLEAGMVEETKLLLEKGIPEEKLVYYGLEYKYLTWYLAGKLSYDEMFSQLNTAIHQFAKRQMTWFRKMERNGFPIHWLNGDLSLEEKLSAAIMAINRFKNGKGSSA